MTLPSKYPNTWNTNRFGEIVTIANGQISPQQKPYDEYYHIGPENIVQNTGQIINLKRSKDLNLISGKYLFDANSIVYSKIRPNLNKVCLPDFIGICSADAYPISPKKDKVTKEYLYHFMLSQLFTKQSIACSMRTGLPKINRQELNAIIVLLPPLAEQKKIAEILGVWDEGIEKTEKLIAAKQKLKKGLMQQLLTGKKRFKEFIKSNKFDVVHGLESPSDWKVLKLGSLGQTYTGLAGKNKEDFGKGKPYIPYLNIFNNSRIDLNQLDYAVIEKDERQYKVQYGDIFFTTSSETADEVGMASVLLDDVEEMYLNSFCFGFRLSSFDVILPEYARYCLRGDNIRDEIYKLAQGATRYNLSKAQLMKLYVSLPSIKEQQKIASVLNAADQEINLLQKKLEAIKQQKKGLMQKLLTGKIRVKV